ncbi:hypothetical protein EYB53_024645 [Candidatus Chloroploca sp. M-50]|uniref:Uncharacterized protein n=1 Tax=Candidatus Chloroploca mongolica TaxID=2528176 RepID=A0ABS4DHJ5_9CHLR|nr:hypothetical protein [Candidatus Chloroploca mongolica]MBP1468921.1 hypothetical protein [Candidatus Chloroploca mongolica]
MLVVHRLAEQQQIALLSREEEDQAHHDRQGCLIDRRLSDVGKQRAPAIFINAVEGVKCQLDLPPGVN